MPLLHCDEPVRTRGVRPGASGVAGEVRGTGSSTPGILDTTGQHRTALGAPLTVGRRAAAAASADQRARSPVRYILEALTNGFATNRAAVRAGSFA
jgi:hypothetical protein